ncbi:MAG TPA: esterase-like activity of phytase family protein [Puia sp.]
MEGLTMTPDGNTLVGIMQNPLYNPSVDAVSGSAIIRILTFDISSGNTKHDGKLFGGQTVEQLKDSATLVANGIKPVSKTLVSDLMKDIDPVYPHDKAEGLFIINSKLIAVSNDDDFGITGSNGVYQQKIFPATNMVDGIVFILLSL